MKHACTIALSAALVIAFAPALYAYGAGGYVTVHYGSYRWIVDESIKMSDSSYGGINRPAPGRPAIVGGGILWDSCLAKDEMFNFRQHIGFNSHLKSTVRLTEFGLTNTFGFSPYRTRLLRLWLGPQINFRYMWGSDARNYYTPSVYATYYPWAILAIKRTYKFATLGTGIAVGLNINVHKYVTVAVEAGFQISTAIWGEAKDLSPVSASCWGYEGFVTVSAMGRFLE